MVRVVRVVREVVLLRVVRGVVLLEVVRAAERLAGLPTQRAPVRGRTESFAVQRPLLTGMFGCAIAQPLSVSGVRPVKIQGSYSPGKNKKLSCGTARNCGMTVHSFFLVNASKRMLIFWRCAHAAPTRPRLREEAKKCRCRAAHRLRSEEKRRRGPALADAGRPAPWTVRASKPCTASGSCAGNAAGWGWGDRKGREKKTEKRRSKNRKVTPCHLSQKTISWKFKIN